MRVAIYPQAGLVACHGLLLNYEKPTSHAFGLHNINTSLYFRVRSFDNELYVCIKSSCPRLAVIKYNSAKGAGLQRVRRVQRWWRGRLWRRQAEKHLAFMMAAHARLGAASMLGLLDEELLRLCVPCQ